MCSEEFIYWYYRYGTVIKNIILFNKTASNGTRSRSGLYEVITEFPTFF
jgi:hypothetical protein